MSDEVSAAVHAFLAGEKLVQTRDYLARRRALEEHDWTIVAAALDFRDATLRGTTEGSTARCWEMLKVSEIDELVGVGDKILAEATDERKRAPPDAPLGRASHGAFALSGL